MLQYFHAPVLHALPVKKFSAAFHDLQHGGKLMFGDVQGESENLTSRQQVVLPGCSTKGANRESQVPAFLRHQGKGPIS